QPQGRGIPGPSPDPGGHPARIGCLGAGAHQERHPLHAAALRAMQEEVEIEIEASVDQLDRWFVSRIAPTPDGMVSYSRDVTWRHRAEEAARANAELVQALAGSTTDAVFAKDLEGRYVMANKATAWVLGTARERIIGRRDPDFLPPDLAKMVAENDRRVIEKGGSILYEERLDTPRGP